jgi:hypothetical protein
MESEVRKSFGSQQGRQASAEEWGQKADEPIITVLTLVGHRLFIIVVPLFQFFIMTEL